MAIDPWYVYIVRCADGSLYTGVCLDLEQRIETHNMGRGAKYTRSRLPVELVYSKRYFGKGPALRREAELKRYTKREKEALILGLDESGR